MTTYTKEEQAEARALWVSALRSGVYQQTTGYLGDANVGYCCLGVASELAVNCGIVDAYEPRDGEPLSAIVNWLGISPDFGTSEMLVGADDYDSGASLVELNDDYGYTFDQIADVIETKLVLADD